MNLPHSILVDRLTKHSQALALPLGRKVGEAGHEVARQYLLKQMNRLGLKPFKSDDFNLSYEMIHPVTRDPQIFHNLVGVIPGRDRTLPPILLGAHYDSVIDAPCVDDNATSVAHNLVLADHYTNQPLERDLIIAFFDAEEPPFFLSSRMGSNRFVEDHCEGMKFAAAIITDLVGHDASLDDLQLGIPKSANLLAPGISKLLAVMGAETDGTFPEIVKDAAKGMSALRVMPFPYYYVGPVSDHAAFSKAGHPFLFLSCGQGVHYHTPQDIMEWINFDKLAHITIYISKLVEKINATPLEADRTPRDAFDMEIEMIRSALGRPIVTALSTAGIRFPESRAEFDQLIEDLSSGKLTLKAPWK